MKFLSLLFLIVATGLSAAEKKAPNIVFILADDLGITDINAFARHYTKAKQEELFYETPNLDKLISEGISFSQSYANQLCSPTRAAIQTGLIPSRLGITTATPNTKTYHNQGITPPENFNPHDVLEHKDPIAGKLPWINATTNTALDPSTPTWATVLKTHDSAFLGKWHLGGHGAADRQPAAFGYEELAYFDAGGSPYFNWQAQWNRTKPYFPTQATPFRIGKSDNSTGEKYLTDDEAIRAQRFIESRKGNPKPFLLYYCPFAVHTPLQALPEDIKHFSSKPQLGHLGHNNPTYAAMLKHLDMAVGTIRASLEKAGLAENTIIIFTSDNGGVEYSEPAATDNQPFKGGKATLFEGGVRVPTIVFQPNVFTGGKWCNAVIDCTDFLPTVAEITGNPAPPNIDGKSFLYLLKNPSDIGEKRTLIWHYPFNVKVNHPDNGQPLSPHSGIRVGDFKLIWDWHGKLDLYNIAIDPFEKENLAELMPEITANLHNQLKTWLTENVAPRYFPKRDKTISDESANNPFPFKDLR